MIRLWGRSPAAPAGSRTADAAQASASPPPTVGAWRAAALQLGHGAVLPPALEEAFAQEAGARAAGVRPGWPRLSAGPLRLCCEGLPDWWMEGGNLLLLGEGVEVPQLLPDLVAGTAKDGVLAIGAGSRCNQVIFSGESNLVVVEERCLLPTTGIAALSGGTVLVGAETTSTFLAQLDARNGGVILIGRDNMWAAGVRLMTDDMHAIRDIDSGRRLNVRGGRVVIEPHVWLCERVIVMGGSVIGAETVVGAASIVKNARLPANSVCVGAPARVVRHGVTWSREDVP